MRIYFDVDATVKDTVGLVGQQLKAWEMRLSPRDRKLLELVAWRFAMTSR